MQPAFADTAGSQIHNGSDLKADSSPKILVLHSYYPTFEWSNMITKSIRDTFAGSNYSEAEIYLEYMDAKRHPEKEYIDSLAEVYRHRYTDPDEFDLIICTDNHAIDFICSDDDIEIFPGVPIVFCGANSYDSKWKKNRPLLTGIVETIEPADTLNTMLKLHPNTKRILVVSDNHTLTSLIVTDFGEGVSDEDKPLLFERFKRVGKKGVKGTGLGLAIVKRIVDLHGGSVGIEDNPQGQGSVFWVSVRKT